MTKETITFDERLPCFILSQEYFLNKKIIYEKYIVFIELFIFTKRISISVSNVFINVSRIQEDLNIIIPYIYCLILLSIKPNEI